MADTLVISARTRATLILVTVFTVYWLVVLRLDTQTDAATQAMLGIATWMFLAVALWFSPGEERIQVFVLIGVATISECIGSLVWGAYTYRLDNLPLYVPPGHGLFYLTALRLAELPLLNRHARRIVWSMFVGATALLVHNLVATPPDLVGLITWSVLLLFILRARFALLYAISFTVTMALEFYGTSLGIWTWAAILPVWRLPAANPPACIGAGYCVMDSITRWLTSRWSLGIRRRSLPTSSE